MCNRLFAHTKVHIATAGQISVPVQALMCPSNPGHGIDGHGPVTPAAGRAQGKTLAIHLGLPWRACVWKHRSMMLLLPKRTKERDLGSIVDIQLPQGWVLGELE